MNLYEVFYSYTEPCEECPECLVEGSMEVQAVSHHSAKADLRYSTLKFKENFKVLGSKLVRRDANKLEKREADSGKILAGVATSLFIDGKEVVLVCPDVAHLREMTRRLSRITFKFREDLVKNVTLKEDK